MKPPTPTGRWTCSRSEEAANRVIPEIVDWICDHAAVAQDARFPYEISIREAISNAVAHGRQHPAAESLELTLNCPEDRVEVTLYDPGSCFSFEQALKRGLDSGESGRGYSILRKYSLSLTLAIDGKTISIRIPLYKKEGPQSPATPINPIRMKTIQQGKCLSLQPEMDLIAAHIPEMRQAAKDAIETGTEFEEVHLNLESVKIVDSSGIGLIIALHNSLQKTAASLHVIHAAPDILDLFKSMRLDQQFTVSGES